MNEILMFIAIYCNKIFLKYGFRLVDSVVSPVLGQAGLIIENDQLRICFVCDRGQLVLHFYSKFDKKKNNFYTFSLIRELLSGEEVKVKDTDVLGDANGRFFQENLENIIASFEKTVINQTLEKLNLLRKQKASRVFG